MESNNINLTLESQKSLESSETHESHKTITYTNLQCPSFGAFDAKSAFIHNFIFQINGNYDRNDSAMTNNIALQGDLMKS